MVKLIQKSYSNNLFDKRMTGMIDSFIFSIDTLAQFEVEFKDRLSKVQGFGDKYKDVYYTNKLRDRLEIYRREPLKARDKVLYEVVLSK